MAPTAQGCLGNLIMPLHLPSRNWQLGDQEVSHENWRGWRDLRSITLLWSSSQKKDHRGAARNTHWRSQTLHSPPTSNQRPGKVYKDQFWSVFEWLFGSWTPSATYDFWHSTTKSSEVFLLLGASKRLFFKLKWTQRIEIPFVSYGTKTLTQGQLRSIDTPEWFSGQDLVLTFSGWHYVSHYTEKFPDTTDELLNNTYVDDVQLGGNDSNQSIKLKKRPQRLRRKEVFISTNGRVTYQSWKNVRKLTSQASRTYAKLEVELILRKQKYWEFFGTKQKINFPFASWNHYRQLPSAHWKRGKCCQLSMVYMICYVLLHQWYHRKDPVQWNLLRWTEVGWTGTWWHLEILE